MWVHMGATWRVRFNDSCSVVMHAVIVMFMPYSLKEEILVVTLKKEFFFTLAYDIDSSHFLLVITYDDITHYYDISACYLDRLANLPTSYIFACINLFILNGDKLSQDSLDRFSRSLHQIIGICSIMTALDLFFDSSRDVAMVTN